MLFILLIVITIAVIIAYLVSVRIKHMSLLSRNGIPGPKPSLITGNMFEYMSRPSVETQIHWIKTYGKVMGYYVGCEPVVLVADPDLAKNIQIKDFRYFTDRQKTSVKHGVHADPGVKGVLIDSKGAKWKQLRSVLTPTFTTSKLKTMTPIIDDSINTFIDIVDKHSSDGQEFDIYELFQNLTADVVLRSAFGFETNVQNESNLMLLKAVKDIFNFTFSDKWMITTIRCFPILDLILYPFRRAQHLILHTLGMSSYGLLNDMAKDVIQRRRQDPNMGRKDLLQLMIDTKLSERQMSTMTDQRLIADSEDNEIKSSDHNLNASKDSKTYYSLTDKEIEVNCVLFYEAGFETTSTALAFMAHILVNHPGVQERMRQEVRQLYERDGRLDINVVSKLEFMERVFKETSRLYPPLIAFTTRECLADYKYGDITIPKGTAVRFSTYYMHTDPDYWPQPELFDPDRFSPGRRDEIHWSSWQTFGSGPRNCIGMRFALFQLKLTLAKLLMRYRLEASPKTEMGQLSTQCKIISRAPKHGVYVKAVKIV